MPISLGKASHDLRNRLKLSLRGAAAELGISYVHLCNVENGKASLSPDTIERFHDAWGIDLYMYALAFHGDDRGTPKALRGPVKAANEAGTPVIIFDSSIDDSEIVSFVATDNRAAGAKAGEAMVEKLGGKGTVIVLRYQEGSASTNEREEGFLEAVRAGGLEVLSDEQYAGASSEEARQNGGRLLQRFISGNRLTVDGVFCPNESSAFGMLLAMREAGVAGTVAFFGFDSNEKLLDGLRNGDVDGLILQDPFNMGYITVKTIVAHLNGESVEPLTDTGSTLVTSENIDSDVIQKLLNPLG